MSEPESAGTPPDAKSAPAPSPPPIGRRIEFLTACRYVFDQLEWGKSLIMLSVFILIPVLNQLVLMGYGYEITEMLHRRRGVGYPLFDPKRFADYVTRGVWPFLVALIVQTILIPIQVLLLDGTMIGTMAAIGSNQRVATIIAAVVVPTIMIGFIVVLIAMAVGLTPFFLRAGLSQDFAQTFKTKWALDFLKRTWLETLLVNLFSFFLTVLLLPLGCLVCFYGIFVAISYLTIVNGHLEWQLYELYLARGGEPIPLKPLPAEVPPVVTGH